MSMHKTAYLMLGIRMLESEFPGEQYDDEWLPYVEGHEGVEMSIQSGEGDDYLYIGKVLEVTSHYADATFYEVDPLTYAETQKQVDTFLADKIGWTGKAARLMFFELWG